MQHGQNTIVTELNCQRLQETKTTILISRYGRGQCIASSLYSSIQRPFFHTLLWTKVDLLLRDYTVGYVQYMKTLFVLKCKFENQYRGMFKRTRKTAIKNPTLRSLRSELWILYSTWFVPWVVNTFLILLVGHTNVEEGSTHQTGKYLLHHNNRPLNCSSVSILMSFNTEQLSVVRTQGDDLIHYCKYQTLDRDKMVVVRMLRLCSDSVPGSFLWRSKKLSVIFIYYEQQQRGAAQVVHTHLTSCRRGWPRGLGVQFSLLNIFSPQRVLVLAQT